MNAMPALPLSGDQLAEAAQLKSLFQQWQQARRDARLPFSQEAACEHLGFGQSALAQYLNGKIPLNVEAGIKLANLLGVSLGDFSPSLASQAARFAEAAAPQDDAHAVAALLGGRRITMDEDYAPVLSLIHI